jgi:hypothetical protein
LGLCLNDVRVGLELDQLLHEIGVVKLLGDLCDLDKVGHLPLGLHRLLRLVVLCDGLLDTRLQLCESLIECVDGVGGVVPTICLSPDDVLPHVLDLLHGLQRLAQLVGRRRVRLCLVLAAQHFLSEVLLRQFGKLVVAATVAAGLPGRLCVGGLGGFTPGFGPLVR